MVTDDAMVRMIAVQSTAGSMRPNAIWASKFGPVSPEQEHQESQQGTGRMRTRSLGRWCRNNAMLNPYP